MWGFVGVTTEHTSTFRTGTISTEEVKKNVDNTTILVVRIRVLGFFENCSTTQPRPLGNNYTRRNWIGHNCTGQIYMDVNPHGVRQVGFVGVKTDDAATFLARDGLFD